MSDFSYWYSTLSAIPQALAAMVAVVSTFAVLKMGRIDDEVKELTAEIKRFIHPVNAEEEIGYIYGLHPYDIKIKLDKALESLNKSSPDLDSPAYEVLKDLYTDTLPPYQRNVLPSAHDIYNYMFSLKVYLDDLFRDRGDLFKLIRRSAEINLLPIVVCLLLLPNSDLIKDHEVWAWSPKVMSLVAALCFWLTTKNMMKVSRIGK